MTAHVPEDSAGWLCPQAVAALAAVLAVVGAAPLSAEGSAPAGVTIDLVSVARNGQHEIWVSVLDAQGSPVRGLGPQLSVEEDGRIVRDVDVAPSSERQKVHDLTVLVDNDLLQAPAIVTIQKLLTGLGEEADAGDRLIVRSTVRGSPALTRPLAESAQVGQRLAELRQDGKGQIYDAVLAAVRDLSRGGGTGRGRSLLLVTRGADEGSRGGALEVLAVARARRVPVTISAVLLEDRGPSAQGERLVRLCLESGGAALRVRSAPEVAEAGSRLVARTRGGYILRFRPPRWNPAVPNHTVTVTVESAAGGRRAHREFLTSAVLAPPWWRVQLLWVAFAAVVLLAGAALLLFAQRRICRLIVAGGIEEGCQYEVFVMPLRIGASEANDLTFPHPRVSRHHAIFERRGSSVELVDLNSENGTFVNGDAITRRRLVRGDRISLGGEIEVIFDGKD
jgi:hypothetical protein